MEEKRLIQIAEKMGLKPIYEKGTPVDSLITLSKPNRKDVANKLKKELDRLS